jgi:hypothetical protein
LFDKWSVLANRKFTCRHAWNPKLVYQPDFDSEMSFLVDFRLEMACVRTMRLTDVFLVPGAWSVVSVGATGSGQAPEARAPPRMAGGGNLMYGELYRTRCAQDTVIALLSHILRPLSANVRPRGPLLSPNVRPRQAWLSRRAT